MADIKAFLREQERIYRERFREQAAAICRDGFKPDPVVTGEKGGFLVVFLPDTMFRFRMHTILDILGKRIISRDIPHILYGTNPFKDPPATVHSTIADYQVADHFVPPFNNFIVDRLRFAVEKAVRSLPMTTRRRCAVKYKDHLLCNGSTVIAPGQPNEEWLIMVERIIERCGSAGIELRHPWGAHMTLARFTETVEPKRAKRLLSLVRLSPLVFLRPRSIGVGTFTFNARDGFRADWWKKIRIY